MRRVIFQDEAEKRNVSIEAIRKIYEKLLSEGKLRGIIDTKNGEFIHYTSQEIDELVKLVDSKHISMTELAKRNDLKLEQARLIIDKLLEDGRITGTFSQDGAFISNIVLRNMVVEMSKESTSIDIQEISHKLSVPEEEVRLVLEDLSELVVNATLPYRRIKFADLSQETKLPENFIIALLKTLISEGKVSGSLDLVNGTLVKVLPQISPEEETQPSGRVVLSVFGIIVILIGFACIAYAVTPNPKIIQSLENQINGFQSVLNNYVLLYGWDSTARTIKAQIETLRLTLEEAKQPVYPYRGLGIVIFVAGMIVLGVGLALKQK
jgi:DNA-binding Lrp family transcriptional regulator